MSGPIYRTKLFADVADRIREQIRSGCWQPGQRLPSEADLARQFDVSRSTIRYAVHSLRLSGLLYSRPGSGNYISPHAPALLEAQDLACIMSDPGHLRDLVQARYVLEPQLAAMAAKRAARSEVDALLQIVAKMSTQTNRAGLMSLGHTFHLTLAEMSHNAVLCGLYRPIASQMRSMRVLESLTLEIYLQGVDDHRRIAQAVSTGNAEQAREFMRRHLESDYADYMDGM